MKKALAFRSGSVSTRLATLIASSFILVSPAAGDTVRLSVGQRLERFADLTPGAHRYIRYLINKDGSRQLVDIWDRRVSLGRSPTEAVWGCRSTSDGTGPTNRPY